MWKYKLRTSRLSKVIVSQTDMHTYILYIQTDRQAYRHDKNYTPRRFADGQQYCTETIRFIRYWPFTCYGHFVLQRIALVERERSVYQNVQYFIRSKLLRIVIWISRQLDILCSRAVQLLLNYTMLKMTIHCHVSPVFTLIGVHISQKIATECSSDFIIVNFLLWRALQQNYIVKTSETLIIWSAFC